LTHEKLAKSARQHGTKVITGSRNLRDAMKPDDLVLELFFDSNCESQTADTVVMHGNSCFMDTDDEDGSISLAKVGCSTGVNSAMRLSYVNYGAADENDCSGHPAFSVNAPFPFGSPGSTPHAGECFPFEDGMYARAACSGKDPNAFEHGLHMLQ